ncbi:hypothetical protein PVAND_013175 [Polypedilum vanderplanki]|uniref:NIF3-like protein 1 n=1 Tax=Polypedilum vanderplanki TaxID=319348 RepID=A0A9J6CPK5_POLVA|nr:hypothetical protein PVAND_013175 [Polypedilum vanderplanki]
MKLSQVIDVLEKFGPLCYAEKWDNVGLLIEPTAVDVKKILLTNDLTENVMKEAVEKQCNMIISYHPPIFQGLKRITSSQWKERIVIGCLENKIALYSPHTIWDAIENGTSEWLAESLPISSIKPVISNLLNPNFGAGRVCEVNGPLTLRDAIEKIKVHTDVNDVRVAISYSGSLDSEIKTFGCCPGSGASVLKEIKEPIDLFITGEMSHHELLDAVSNNKHVIMLNHSNSERGYLKYFAPHLINLLKSPEIEILVSTVDTDPLKTV